MLANVCRQVVACFEEADAARLRAAACSGPQRAQWLRIERRWIMLAESYQTAERVSGFLEWRARGLRD